jgi:DNA adenine methylase
MPEKTLLNDINVHVINFYTWLKKGLIIDLEMANDSSVYYQYRQRFNELIRNGKANSSEAAELFYYLNRTGYNGLCRFNSKGEFNVPFGKYKTINYMTIFQEYARAFKNWEFSSGDFDKIVLAKDDFIYADPPYDVEFTKYSKEDFGWDDQVRLAEWLAKHPGPVVLSNQATERIGQLYSRLGFTLQYLKAPRMISCTGDRTPANEVLALKGFPP